MSVSLPAEDLEFLDAYASAHGIGSRSAALQRAVRLLRTTELGSAYEDAFVEWEATGAGTEWDVTAADGLSSDAAG